MQALLPRFALICIGLTPLLFLSVRHWVHIWFFILFLLGTTYWVVSKASISRKDLWPLIILASPVIAILISQLLRAEFTAKSFDAPARLLAAVPIYILIRDQLAQKVLRAGQLIQALALSSALALLVLPLFIDEARTAFYGDRIATERADTNTLGSYVGVLIIFSCIGLWHTFSQQAASRNRRSWLAQVLVLLFALMVGADALLATQSRGAWIAFVICLAVLLICLLRLRPKQGLQAIALGLLTLAISAGLGDTARYAERIQSIPAEVASWIHAEKPVSSGSIRLNMLEASYELLKERPLSGYGHLGYAQRLKEQPYLDDFSRQTREVLSQTGPHQGLAARALESGTPGLLAGLTLFLGPIVYLYRANPLKAIRAQKMNAFLLLMGLLFFVQLFALQFTIEPYALRFLASFNAVMLAVFLSVARVSEDEDFAL